MFNARIVPPALGILLLASVNTVQAASHQKGASAGNVRTTVEDVVVRARRRDENLQEVPMAIDVISSDEIFERGLNDLNAIVGQSPSLVLDEGSAPQDLRISVRGLSPTRGRQNVAVLLDGIDISSESLVTAGGTLLIDPRLFDLEQVEIVKGPQNALYGRSAFAGAISYTTRLPSSEFAASVDTDIGNFEQAMLRARISGPLMDDKLSAGVSAATWTNDGYYRTDITGERIGGSEGATVAGTLVWTPAESWSVVARLSYEDSEREVEPNAHPAPDVVFPMPTAALGPVLDASVTSILGVRGAPADASGLLITNSENPRTGSDYPGTAQEVFRGTLEISKDFESLPLFGAARLTSLTHYADTSSFQFQDFNAFGSAAELPAYGELWIDNDTDLFSQDVRLDSADNSQLTWTLGALYWQERKDLRDGGLTCLTYAPPFVPAAAAPPCGPFVADVGVTLPRNPDTWFRDTDHWSVYGLVGWEFSEGWTLTLEGRYVDEELKVGGPDLDNSIIDPTNLFGGGATFFPPLPGVNTGRDDDSFFAPKATLDWRPDDRSMFYFSIAEGLKPSGISTVSGGVGVFDPDENRFQQERVIVYELGAKVDSFGGRLRTNGAIFFQDFTDKQVTSQVPDESGILKSRVLNADAEVFGLELDVIWLATQHLTLRGAYTYLDTEYTDFKQLTQSAGTIAYTGGCELFTTTAGDTTCRVSYDGRELERAPRHALVASASYSRELTRDIDWYAQVQTRFTDSRYANPANLLEFDAYWLTDFRLGFSSDAWEIIGYIDNLLDDDTIRTGFNSGGYLLNFELAGATFVLPDSGQFFLPPPRTYGVRATYRFGGGRR